MASRLTPVLLLRLLAVGLVTMAALPAWAAGFAFLSVPAMTTAGALAAMMGAAVHALRQPSSTPSSPLVFAIAGIVAAATLAPAGAASAAVVLLLSVLQCEPALAAPFAGAAPAARPAVLHRAGLVCALSALALAIAALSERPALRAGAWIRHGALACYAAATGQPGPGAAASDEEDFPITADLDARDEPAGRAAQSLAPLGVIIHSCGEMNPSQLYPLYLRLMTFDTYLDGSWSSRRIGLQTLVDRDDGAKDGRITVAPPWRETVRYSVVMKARPSLVMPVIPNLNALEQAAVVRRAYDAYAPPVALSNGMGLIAFTATSSGVTWDRLPERERQLVSPRQDAGNLYLEPGDLTDAIDRLTHSVIGTNGDPAVVLETLRDYVRAQCRYALSRTPDGQDPVATFLFQSHKGRCLAFASSLTLMLRCAGIPARLATGFSGGFYDAAQEAFFFSSEEAHAWTEVRVKGAEWVPVEATPLSAGSAGPAGRRMTPPPGFSVAGAASLADLVRLQYREGAGDPFADPAASRFSFARLPFDAVFGLLALAAAVLVFLAGMFWRGLARRRADPARRFGRAPSYFRFFCAVFARQGHPIRRGQTAAEYLASLKSRGLLGDEADALVEYFQETCYGTRRRSASCEADFVRLIRRMESNLRTAARSGACASSG